MDYKEFVYKNNRPYILDFSEKSCVREVLIEERLEQLLSLFKNKDIVTGKEIVKDLQLSDDDRYIKGYGDNPEYIKYFFKYFLHENKVLVTNPGYDEASSLYVINHYGLTKEYQRELKINRLLDN